MKGAILLVCSILLVAASAFASVTGSITGRVTDKAGAVVPGANVVAVNVEAGVKTSTKTNKEGVYSFPDLPIGHYSIQIQASGFSKLEETGIALDVNSALRLDATLQVGSVVEQIEVSGNAVQVDTISTQLGAVIGSTSMTSLPLNGRSFTDLLALQPGVVPTSVNLITGASNEPPSGDLDSGTLSISGARGSSNGFMVNGGNVQEQMANGTAIIPNIDSIAEFRIITNNFDAEYGHYSGGVVNIITKSGTNQFHGDGFEFLRNTDLDARNYYSPTRGVYRQNQFGGTLGGPFIREKLFFFADYQGTRQTVGAATGLVPVPSAADRQGNLADQASQLTGTVIGPAVANTLTQNLGYPVKVGEPFYTSGCTSQTCVFPNAFIPPSVWSAPSPNLFQFIPLPNVPASSSFPTGAYSSSSANEPLQDDKAGFRIDANTRWGLFPVYYFVDKYSLVDPFFSGGSFGQFGGSASGLAQLYTVGNTKSFGASMVNEFRFSYMRNASDAGTPTGPDVDVASLGFVVGCNGPGICPQNPAYKTLPAVSTNEFTIGGPTNDESLRENTFQVQENFSRVVGTHNLNFGGIFSYSQLNDVTTNTNNGAFVFSGSAETGLDFADLLLGATTVYEQGVQFPLYNRGLYYGIYGQDSWRASRNLTVNYGLRWDVTTPWWEKYNRMEALVPGAQSASFPTAPEGWLVAGDRQIPRTVAPTQYTNVSPRIGVAYSPDPKNETLRKLTGGQGQTSIRASFGIFFNDFENYTQANANGDAPYGLFYVSPTAAQFATPFVDLYTGNSEGQRFPIPNGVGNASPSNPDASVNWAQFEPITSSPTWYYKNVTPYVESWMLSLQRQIVSNTVLSMTYVGNVGRHALVDQEANPSTPSVCLGVSQPNQVAAGSNICGPNAETGVFTTASGQVIQARQQAGLGPNFGSDGWFRTEGGSAYNALEVSLQYNHGRTAILGAYTYSKSLDNSSSVTEQVQPFNPGLLWGLSSFNIKHNFVTSYSYELPFDKAFRHSDQLTRGCILSGITRFSTGFPITMMENDDHSLIGNTATGPNGNSTDVPNFTPGKILAQTNPRNGGSYFNTSLFSPEAIGQFGNSNRRFFGGPGINNFDMALAKDTHFTESMSLELRFEFFNVFNHAQFNTPTGLINSGSFGAVTSAANPRIGQVAAKFHF
jgi:hypothetical protein